AVIEVGHLYLGSEGERLVRRRELVLVVHLAAGQFPPLELVAVEIGDALLRALGSRDAKIQRGRQAHDGDHHPELSRRDQGSHVEFLSGDRLRSSSQHLSLDDLGPAWIIMALARAGGNPNLAAPPNPHAKRISRTSDVMAITRPAISHALSDSRKNTR